MKPTAGPSQPRRVSPSPRPNRLNLKGRPKPEPRDDIGVGQESSFWKWVLIVAFLHVVVISALYLFYAFMPQAKPVEQIFSLLPPGDVVKGKPGQQQAHKVAPTNLNAAAAHAAPTPPAPVKPPTPVKAATPPPTPVVKTPPPPELKPDALSQIKEKPVVKPPPPVKPTPPKPKVKVDLHLADAPATDAPKPVKPTPKKTVPKADANDSGHDNAKSKEPGLSKEQIAAKLGDKSDAPGTKNAVKTGKSGSANSHANSYADFYAAIRDQVMDQWQSPNLADEQAINPVVHIFVMKDGTVPPGTVYLQRSSGNPTYDNSAVAAAKSLGHLHEPLPDGCPPDIPITFKLTR